MNCVSCDICVYNLGLCVFFPGVFLSSRLTGACLVTTDLIMRVNVRTTTATTTSPVTPVAYQVILEPGIGQFRELEPPRVHSRKNSWELFLVHKLTCGKRKSVS